MATATLCPWPAHLLIFSFYAHLCSVFSFIHQLRTVATPAAADEIDRLKASLLQTLSELLLQPDLTMLVANSCRPVLMDLALRYVAKGSYLGILHNY